MPRPRRPHRASPDEIRITRDGDYAIIAYADDAVATTHFKIGSEQLAQMTDEQIIDFWNDGIDARDRFMAAQELIAVEIPMGKPQLKYEEWSCPDLADRFDCLNQVDALVSNSMGDT